MHTYHFLAIVLCSAAALSASVPFGSGLGSGSLVHSPVLTTCNIADYCPCVDFCVSVVLRSCDEECSGVIVVTLRCISVVQTR